MLCVESSGQDHSTSTPPPQKKIQVEETALITKLGKRRANCLLFVLVVHPSEYSSYSTSCRSKTFEARAWPRSQLEHLRPQWVFDVRRSKCIWNIILARDDLVRYPDSVFNTQGFGFLRKSQQAFTTQKAQMLGKAWSVSPPTAGSLVDLFSST